MTRAAIAPLVLILACRAEPRVTTNALQPPPVARGALETRKSPPLPELEPHEPYRIGNGVTAPVTIHRVEPKLSDLRTAHFMVFEAVVTKEGTVRDIRSLRGPDDEAVRRTIAALRQWRFKPGLRNGVPVDVLFNLTVNVDYR